MLKGYRTIIFNLIAGTLGILEAADLTFIPDPYGKYILIIVPIVNLWLRTITTGPIGQK